MSTRFCSRPCGWLVVAALSLSACHHWVPVSPDSVRAGQEDLRGEVVRVSDWTSGDEEFVVNRVAYPFIEGWDLQRGRIRVDLTNANAITVRQVRVGPTVAIVLGSIALTFLVGWGVLASAFRDGRS